MRRFVIIASLLALVLATCLPAAPLAADAAPRDEYTVKAAFILNIARLVTWPKGTFAEVGSTNQIVIGLVGSAPLVSRMMRSMDDKVVRGHQVVTRAVETAEDLDGCHIVFIMQSAADVGEEYLRAVSRRAVLVVGEMEGFAGRGAVINLYDESRKIRFEVNRQAAKRQNLKISSRLLGLARIVPDTPASE